MPLTTLSPSGFVTSLQQAITGYTTKIKNFASGSAMGALVNAVATQLLFLQSQAQYVYSVTRAATSTGADLTSFGADYALSPTRIAAVAASTQLLYFGKYQAPSAMQVIPVGTIVQTPTAPPGTPVQFTVIADTTNPNYNPALNGGLGGYAIPAGTSVVAGLPGQANVAVTAQCTIGGTVGNVLAGTLSIIVTPGVPADYCSNTAAIQNGLPQETDAALLLRFENYISSLATANLNSLAAAIEGVAVNLTFTINDQLNASDVATSAAFCVVVDDGSGAIPAATLASVSAAVNLKRAAGIAYSVIAPTNETITVVVSGTVVAPSFSAGVVRAAIQAAIIAYINANGVGGANLANLFVPSLSVSYVGIANVVAGFIGTLSTQGLLSYASITVNGGTSNVMLTPYQLARATTGSVTVD